MDNNNNNIFGKSHTKYVVVKICLYGSEMFSIQWIYNCWSIYLFREGEFIQFKSTPKSSWQNCRQQKSKYLKSLRELSFIFVIVVCNFSWLNYSNKLTCWMCNNSDYLPLKEWDGVVVCCVILCCAEWKVVSMLCGATLPHYYYCSGECVQCPGQANGQMYLHLHPDFILHFAALL